MTAMPQAAEALHRSQSSVSYMVARLQEQLGLELFSMERPQGAADQEWSGKAVVFSSGDGRDTIAQRAI
ncbi:helix-turn-helix domain-containing protein [Cupriavidus necator]|uniref:helix-turn-helix domain-containing protein n=1 Tax=Cupriavidus necator TaxID=106590 RepID=UPI0007C70CA6